MSLETFLRIFITLLLGVVGGMVYLVVDTILKRRQLDGLPQPPMDKKFFRLFGHLPLADEFTKMFPKSSHIHLLPNYLRDKFDLPEIFYVDWRPFGGVWLFVIDPEYSAEFIYGKQSLPKSDSFVGYLNRLLGDNNLVSIEGAHWKSLRSMFNPGFSAGNIMTMVDYITEAGERFRDIMYQKAETGELFELEEYATRATIDIIGRVTMDLDMNTQVDLHPIAFYFRERIATMPAAEAMFFWQDVQITRPFRLWLNKRRLVQAISSELDLKIKRRAQNMKDESAVKVSASRKRSVIDLALSTYEKEIADTAKGGSPHHISEPSQLPPNVRADIITSVMTFFFAGHDTTSSTIAWVFYLLHRYPRVQAKLAEELDTVFPPGKSAADAMREDPYILNQLEYLTAVIRETLRLFPPASTIRSLKPQYPSTHTVITDPKTGAQYPLANTDIWPIVHAMNRNRRFFPEPTQFIPERFIQSQTPFPDAELFQPSGKHAFTPFGHGPRNCIGQELAMVESKVILALTVRELDFVLEFPGEEPDPQPPIPESSFAELGRPDSPKNVYEGHRVYQILKATAKPAGGCPGRMKLRSR